MNDFKNELTFKEINDKKNILEIYIEYDSNDADFIGELKTFKPEKLFNNKKLIYCLAYISCPYDFKGHSRDDCWGDTGGKFDTNIDSNYDIDGLSDFLCDNDLMLYSDWGPCHSLESLQITYYDENGTAYEITFDDIHKRWEQMSYDAICNEINNI